MAGVLHTCNKQNTAHIKVRLILSTPMTELATSLTSDAVAYFLTMI